MMNDSNNKIFVWNCHRATSTAWVCKRYMELRVDPFKLQKTFELLGFDGFLGSDGRGFAGGIIVAWKLSKVSISLIAKDFQFLHVKVVTFKDIEWYFTTVYASPIDENKRHLWVELKRIVNFMQGL